MSTKNLLDWLQWDITEVWDAYDDLLHSVKSSSRTLCAVKASIPRAIQHIQECIQVYPSDHTAERVQLFCHPTTGTVHLACLTQCYPNVFPSVHVAHAVLHDLETSLQACALDQPTPKAQACVRGVSQLTVFNFLVHGLWSVSSTCAYVSDTVCYAVCGYGGPAVCSQACEGVSRCIAAWLTRTGLSPSGACFPVTIGPRLRHDNDCSRRANDLHRFRNIFHTPVHISPAACMGVLRFSWVCTVYRSSIRVRPP
jgi:hypothetical protein